MGSVLNKQVFSACKGYVGLKNQGATCYLNTLLQTWFMTPEVNECIASVNSNSAFVCELKKIFKDLESREETCLGTDELTRILRINVYQQCDIEVCFRIMITKLCTEMDQDHDILKFYQIPIVQSMKCLLCGSLVEVDFPLLDLPLPLHRNSADSAHLETALQEFLKEETMEDDNECYCDKCNGKTKTEMRFYFKQLPKILTFHLRRFEINHYMKRYQKIHDCVTIPLDMEFNKSQDNCNEWILKATVGKVLSSPHVAQYNWQEEKNAQTNHCLEGTDRGQAFVQSPAQQDGDLMDCERREPETAQEQDSSEEKEKKYELFAVWHHVGEFGGGHYYAEIKSVADGNWYYFNDRTVYQRGKQISLSSSTAYVIMYRKTETNSIPATEDSMLNLKTAPKFFSSVLSSLGKMFTAPYATKSPRNASCCDDFKKEPNVSTTDTNPPEISASQNTCYEKYTSSISVIHTPNVGGSQEQWKENCAVDGSYPE